MKSMWRVVSCVVGRECLLWLVCSLAKTLLVFACFILYSKTKLACYSRYFLTSYICIPVPYDEKDIFFFFFGVSSRRSCSLSQNHSTSASLVVGADLDCCDFEWFALEMVCLLSFLRLPPTTAFQPLLLTRRATPFLKGFLPTVVDIMVIWVKFTHSSPF